MMFIRLIAIAAGIGLLSITALSILSFQSIEAVKAVLDIIKGR